MELQISQFVAVLQDYFPFQKARLNFIGSYVLALISASTVNGAQIAIYLSQKATIDSNYRRIQRFFAEFNLDLSCCARFVLSLVPAQRRLVLAYDRTEWKCGSKWVNVHLIGVVVGSVVYPLVWQVTPANGSSNNAQRFELVDKLLRVLAPERIEALVADREFYGGRWFEYLDARNIRFCIRLKRNTLVRGWNGSEMPVKQVFHSLPINRQHRCQRPYAIYGRKLWLSGMRLKKDYCIVATNAPDLDILEVYQQRWSIENLFSMLKTRGFNLEDTHITKPERIEKMVGLLTIAAVWMWKTGQSIEKDKPIPIKAHRRKAKSIFRTGLDFMRRLLKYTQEPNFSRRFLSVLKLLSCT